MTLIPQRMEYVVEYEILDETSTAQVKRLNERKGSTMKLLLAILGIIQDVVSVGIRYRTLEFHTTIRQYLNSVRNVFLHLQKKKKKKKVNDQHKDIYREYLVVYFYPITLLHTAAYY